MSLKDQLKEDMKAAMKAREEGKTALSVIRMVNSAIKNTEINDSIVTILEGTMLSFRKRDEKYIDK